ncbi:Hypothetical predicted protein [Lecanosticta acicola]|uniref:Uncharacterized protein n=1 Tax=Lecanosticta acicola TaxID=111012 RepID=A0AAI8YRV5_9PEZI|nr:Hypothetical predicted protein [Lecanosticta acicola]
MAAPGRGETLGMEADPIVRTFGHLYEGQELGLSSAENVARRLVLVSRWERRLGLAMLAMLPEGYEWTNHLQTGEVRSVILLTPPNRVAIRLANGTWKRDYRIQEVHGPAPYTWEWYLEYLHLSGLPRWFLSLGHAELLGNRAEASVLGQDLHVRTPAVNPQYLEARYPHEPRYHAFNDDNGKEIYKFKPTHSQQLQLARNFPATSMPNKDREVLLLPGGYIQLHHDPDSLPYRSLAFEEIPWKRGACASYILEPLNEDLEELSILDLDNRESLFQQATQGGGIVNPFSEPRGEGEFRWIEDEDEMRAQLLGYVDSDGEPSPIAITRAREIGALAAGIHARAAPAVVFVPNQRYFNPPEQPKGLGHWDFFNKESRELARVQFAGEIDYNFGNITDVTAEQIWRLRQEYIGEFENPTAEIDLVWIPASSFSAAADAEQEDEDAEEAEGPLEEDLGFGVDSKSGLAHWPPNDNLYDQTANEGDEPIYQTRMIRGKKYTVDRAPPKANGIPQEAKLWIPEKVGRWTIYHKRDALDWSDQKSLDALHKWRDQVAARHGWPGKRAKPALGYTKEEKKYIEQAVEAAGGDRSKLNTSNITNAFNEHFKTSGARKRDANAMRQQITLAITAYRKNNGIEVTPKKPKKKTETMEKTEKSETREMSDKGKQPERVEEGPARKKQKKNDDASGSPSMGGGMGGFQT